MLNVKLMRADAGRGLLDASGTPHVVQPRTRLARQAVGQAVSQQGISYTDYEGNSSPLEEAGAVDG
jgi:hypothetical protein